MATLTAPPSTLSWFFNRDLLLQATIDRLVAAAWEEMPIRIEGNLDAGVAHLVANVGGGFSLGNQLAGEEVSQVMKPRACYTGFLCDRLPNL